LQQQQLQQQHNLPTALNPYRSYYSFSMATVHFLMLDSESPSHKGSPQHRFVVQDLAQVRGLNLIHAVALPAVVLELVCAVKSYEAAGVRMHSPAVNPPVPAM
jgi:hypothetical protein